MALRNIVTVGDSVLTKVSRPVTKFDRRLHQLLDDMTETLEDAGGVGLAAPQVGICAGSWWWIRAKTASSSW